MNPKEKAKELVYKMRNEIPCHCDDLEQAKQCALIAVDEMLELFEDKCTDHKYYYLVDVKIEIQKL